MSPPRESFSKLLIRSYAAFLFFVLIDVIGACTSSALRNAFGNVMSPAGFIVRLIPDACLLVMYGIFFYSIRKRSAAARAVVILHSLMYAVISIGFAIPFLGVIIAGYSPVFLPYLGILMIFPPYGYYLTILFALGFSVLNVLFLIEAAKLKLPTIARA